MKIILVKPRGFCAGVDRAIDIVKLALEVYGKPIYVKHAIVHNDQVVNELENQGVTFVESVKEIPKKALAIFSAHGSPPTDYLTARLRKINLIDATCPLVAKVHLEVKRFTKNGYNIILVGHKNHIEILGVSSESPENTTIVESKKDIDNLIFSQDDKIAILTQTTLSVNDAKDLLRRIKNKYPKSVLPPSSDICYATTNRQAAIKYLIKVADLILVVGSATSSNTNRLVKVAQDSGSVAFRINGPDQIKKIWLNKVKTIGITAGASVPESSVKQVVEFFKNNYNIEIKELEIIKEHVWFDLPSKIKKKAQSSGVGKKIISKHNIFNDSKMVVK